MALSKEFLEEGRTYLRNKDLDQFMLWLDRSKIMIDKNVVRDGFSKMLKLNDTDAAVHLFDKAIATVDPTAQRLRVYIRVVFFSCLIFGTIGGIVYLFQMLLS